MNQVDGKQVVNPDESLAELIHRQNIAKSNVKRCKHNLDGAKTEYDYANRNLLDIEKAIDKIEKAAMSGGVVRIM